MVEVEITRRDLLAATIGGATGFGLGFGAGAYSAISKIDNTDSEPTPPSNGNGTGTETPTQTTGNKITVQNRPTQGQDSAQVTMVYWSDYQCPYCTQFEQQTLPQIQSNFVETGEIQLVLKPLTLFGPDSRRAISSAYAVLENYDTSTFWEWHHFLFNKSSNSDKNSGWASPDAIRGYIQNEFSQLDADLIASAVEQGKYQSRADTDLSEARSWGFQGTPFFLMFKGDSATEGKTQTIIGAQPYSEFEQAISNF